MGEILGVGLTHYPALLGQPQDYANILRRTLQSPLIPEEMKNPENWPEPLQEEHANEEELAKKHQERMIANFRKVRKAIDDFGPDAVIIFGDDQYENFKEDIIPPFCIFLHENMESTPFAARGGENAWGEPTDKVFNHKGERALAEHLATELMERDFPISYSYTNSHFAEGHGPNMLTHAFLNALVYLDWDRKGFDYPVVPIQVNCYGKNVVTSRGGTGHLDPAVKDEPFGNVAAPPGPTAASCYRLGQMVRDILEDTPGKFVVMASSGWSHAFLCAKNNWLHPDVETDRQHLEELKAGKQSQWANLTNDEIHNAGDQEFKNWICLAGAMEGRRAEIVDYMETYLFNSNKCFAVFPANGDGSS